VELLRGEELLGVLRVVVNDVGAELDLAASLLEELAHFLGGANSSTCECMMAAAFETIAARLA
jgi:hypothetical protein